NASAPEDENRTAASETAAVPEDGLTFTISYGGIGNLDAEPEDEVEAELEALAEAKRQEEENAETAPEPPAGSAADDRYAQPGTEEKPSEAAETAAAPGMPEAGSDRPGTAEAETAPEPPETEADEHVMMTVTNASSAVLREREKMAAAAARGQEMPAEGGASYGEAAEDTLAEDGEAAQQEAETEGTEAPAEPAKPEMPDEVDLFAGFEDHSKEIRRKLEQRAARSARLGRLPLEADVSKDVWHFMVFGDRDEQTLECAREKMQEIGVISTNAPRKMLKLRAERIGNANIVQSLDRFLGNMVIVEHASALTDEQLQDFAKVLDKDDRSLLIAFTDTEPHLEELFLRVPELANSFTAVYEGKMLTVEDLISEVKEFLFHNDALLTEDGEAYVAAFAQRTMTEGKGFYKSTMRKLAAKALRAAERGGFLGLSMGKVDEDGYLLVSEKYFRRIENQ
ncbi:MAG: hypothetical protein J6U26_04485, partial [Lachnospiraceae bacterium]|nr:hypothetical protein [Lachnospiraceae bacterium]